MSFVSTFDGKVAIVVENEWLYDCGSRYTGIQSIYRVLSGHPADIRIIFANASSSLLTALISLNTRNFVQ